jgi:type I restriction enzyme S subunit
LLCKDGAGIGKLGIISSLPGPATINSSLLLIRVNEGVQPKYLYHALCGPIFQNIVQERIDGATTPHLYQREIKTLKIPLPPLPEQKRIVAILDEAFAGIRLAVTHAEKNLANARELFESHLNKVFTEQGERWVETKLNDICEITSQLVDPREHENMNLPHIGAGNMVSKTGELIDMMTAIEEGLKSGEFIFDPRMVLYSKIRPYLEKVCRPDFIGLCSADVYPLLPNADKLDRDFLFFMLRSKDFTDYAIRGSARAGMPKVNRNHLFQYTVSLPKVPEQKSIVRKLDKLEKETKRLEAVYQHKLSALAELKQSFLQKAFAGELTAETEPQRANG